MTDDSPAPLEVTPVRTGRRRFITGVIGLVCLGLGAWLIVSWFNARVPDPSTATAERLIAFIMSDRFNELSDAERRAFAEQMVKRYGDMDDDQRKLAEDQAKQFAKDNPDQAREQTIKFWKDYVVSEAESYVAVPPDQRRSYLETKMAGWKLMFGERPGQDRPAGERREREDREWAERLGPENQAKANKFLQDEVLPRTSAKDRALATLMMRDLGKMMRE